MSGWVFGTIGRGETALHYTTREPRLLAATESTSLGGGTRKVPESVLFACEGAGPRMTFRVTKGGNVCEATYQGSKLIAREADAALLSEMRVIDAHIEAHKQEIAKLESMRETIIRDRWEQLPLASVERPVKS